MEYKLKDLIDIPRMREVFDTFDAINSMPSAIIDIEGNVLIANSWQDICTKFHRVNPESEKKCIESDTHFEVELEKLTPHVIYKCPMGLVDSASPIIIDGKHLGNVFTGQLFLEPPDEAKFIEQARQYGFDEAEYLAAMRRVPLFTEEQLHKNLTFVHTLAVMTTEQALQQKRALEAAEQLRKSDERHRSILQTTLDGVWMVDMQGRLLEVNESYVRMSGYSVQELLTLRVYDLDFDESPEDTIAQIEAIKHHGTLLFEARHRRKDGSIFDVEVNVQYRSDDDGGQIVAFIRDITERKKTEVALRRSEEHLRSVIETLPVPLALNDNKGNITFFNKEYSKIIGYTLDEIPTVNDWFPLAYPDENYRHHVVNTWSQRLEKTLCTGKPFEPMEITVACKDGKKRDFICNMSVLENDSAGTHLVFFYEITDSKQAELELKHSHELMHYIIQHNQSALAVHDKDMRYVYVSERYLHEYKVKEKDIIGKHHYEVFPDLPQKWRDVHQRALEGVISSSEEDSYERADGSIEWTRWECRPWHDATGEIGGIIVYTEVITERKKAEEQRLSLQNQLQQAQKMESIGRLAGGVAHDFNNMLSVILGHAELGLMQFDYKHPICENLHEIKRSAERSADLTRQLLAFARQQTVSPEIIDLNETVSGMLKMLQRLIGEAISIHWLPAPELWQVKIDTSQLDQILANLCVNARDAISDIGKIIIETRNISVDENFIKTHMDALPGEYVQLSVSDSGCGMSKEMLANIFEPFFTTKELGKGTGLGLATVYGAVKQNNGFIDVYSEPGTGTTFKIYLPRSIDKSIEATTENPAELAKGHETILLVEDELAILKLTKALLSSFGYNVLCASTPGEAMKLAREYNGNIHLLMTDVVMPEMNGRDLAKNLSALYPGIKRLFMSGYTADVIAHHGVLEDGVHFLQKPFNINALSGKLREVLDR
jgi:PAS domain S-box-containing protein